MSATIETQRLLISPLTRDDHEALCTVLCDPAVGATLGGTATPAEVEETLARHVEHWERHGFGYWLLRERATGDVVGRGGLQHVHVGGRDEVEVGWAVTSERWGEGFATELGAAAARVAFEELDRDDIVAFTLPTNRASRRVMEKIGFVYERDLDYKGWPHVLYRLASVT